MLPLDKFAQYLSIFYIILLKKKYLILILLRIMGKPNLTGN